jgi:broad specificity phosphatase PhoE
MARLFLIRHGQPASSWGERESDPGLSEAGRAQAEAAAATLGPSAALKVVSSPMLRCLETAAPYVRARRIDLAVEPRISEIATQAGVEDRAGWLQARFPWRDPRQMRSWPSLEPELQDWRARMLDYVHGVADDTAMFTHFIAINVIVGAAMNDEATIVCKPGHASITELEVTPRALRLVRLGDEMQVDDVR